MATKKASAKTKRPIVAAPTVKPAAATKVTTIKAVDSRPAQAHTARRFSLGSRLKTTPLLAAAIAEFVGTFLLATVIVTQQNQPIALLFGLVGIVLVFGAVSGSHVNPAVTVAAWVTGKIRLSRAAVYVVAQILGAMLALVVLQAFISQAPDVSQRAAMLGQTTPQLFKASPIPGGQEWALLLSELLGATILGLAYASVLRQVVLLRDKVAAGFTIGAGIFLALVIGGTTATYVQGSVILNPAAAISLQAINVSSIWPVVIYIVTTVVGVVLGFVLYDMLANTADETSVTK